MSGADGLVLESSGLAAGPRVYPSRAIPRRIVVRSLGRELYLRQQRSAARTGDVGTFERFRLPGCRKMAALGAESRWRFWRINPFLLRPRGQRSRQEHRFANGVGHYWIARGCRT